MTYTEVKKIIDKYWWNVRNNCYDDKDAIRTLVEREEWKQRAEAAEAALAAVPVDAIQFLYNSEINHVWNSVEGMAALNTIGAWLRARV